MMTQQTETPRVPLWVWGALLLTAAVVAPILATTLGARAYEDPRETRPVYARENSVPQDEASDDLSLEPSAEEPIPERTASTRRALPPQDLADGNAPLISMDNVEPGEVARELAEDERILIDRESAKVARDDHVDPVAAESGEALPEPGEKPAESPIVQTPSPRVDEDPTIGEAPREDDESFQPSPSPVSVRRASTNEPPLRDSEAPDATKAPEPSVISKTDRGDEPSRRAVSGDDPASRDLTPAGRAEPVPESRFALLMQSNPAWRRIQMTYSKQRNVPMVQLVWGSCRIHAYRVQIGATSMVAAKPESTRSDSHRGGRVQLASAQIESPLDIKLNEREMQVSLPSVGDVLTASSVSLKLEGLGLHPEQIDAFLEAHEIQVSLGEFDKNTPAVAITAGPLQILAADVHLEDVVGPIDITADGEAISVKRDEFSLRCTRFKLKGDTLTLSARGQGRIVIEEMREMRARTVKPVAAPSDTVPLPTRLTPTRAEPEAEPELIKRKPIRESTPERALPDRLRESELEPEAGLRPQSTEPQPAPRAADRPDLQPVPARDEEPEATRPEADLTPPKPAPPKTPSEEPPSQEPTPEEKPAEKKPAEKNPPEEKPQPFGNDE